MENKQKFEEQGKVPKKAIPHLVLVDDDPLFIRLFERVAGSIGVRLTAISSPQEAYKSLPELHYDAALFDYDLGRVNGAQLSRFIGHVKPQVPVVLVSHYEGMNTELCPESVVARVEKKAGPTSIIKTVLSILDSKQKKGEPV